MLTRHLLKIIDRYLFQNRAIIIYGARRVGKTTFLKLLENKLKLKSIWFFGDTTAAQSLLKPHSKEYLEQVLGANRLIFIDEAQYISDIDITAKLITDFFPDKQLIISGSSSFELANRTTESLTGRKWIFKMFPFSFGELTENFSLPEEINRLEHRLVFGTYPEVITKPDFASEILKEIHSSYLYKDIFMWANIRKSDKLLRLVKALAFQVGSEVKYRELAQIVGVDTVTVERYIDLLEQSFVIFRLMPFSRNLRDELKNTRKIYFWDNGIRNAIIEDFRPLDLRDDVGQLWENFIVSQIMISRQNMQKNSKFYFWRTHSQQEIDLIEVAGNNEITAYEIKWNPKRIKRRFPAKFVQTYNPSQTAVIHKDNFWQFLL